MRKRKYVRGLVIILLVAASVITVFPVLWTLLTSFKTDVQMYAIPPEVLPDPVTTTHYRSIVAEGNFLSFLRNSVVVAFFSCGISLLAGIPAAYGFAKYSSRRIAPVFAASTAVRMVPQVAMVIPYFMIMRRLHLSDTVWGLVLTYIPFELSLVIWMLKNFFSLVPKEVEEAAELDGLGPWGILFRVVVPLSRSSIGVAGLMSFLFSWNEFMFALSLTSTARAQTLTIGIAGFITSFQTFWGRMSAMGILFMIPAVILAIVFQKDLVKGFTSGAVKG